MPSPELYKQMFVFNDGLQQAVTTLEGLSGNPKFGKAELAGFIDSLHQLRARASAHLSSAVANDEKALVLAMLDRGNGSGNTSRPV